MIRVEGRGYGLREGIRVGGRGQGLRERTRIEGEDKAWERGKGGDKGQGRGEEEEGYRKLEIKTDGESISATSDGLGLRQDGAELVGKGGGG